MAKSNEKGSLLVLVALAFLLGAQLKPAVAGVNGPYTEAMQTDVRGIVHRNIYDAPGLIRLVFHDCWVKGCDASVLLNNTKDANEIHAVQNGGLRGMGMIQEIKEDLTAKYKVKVSCTDAIIFAAREATILLSKNKITYDVAGPGRHDSSTSFAPDAGILPGPQSNLAQLLANFQDKGFNKDELVVLSGAHGIGQAHLPTFKARLDKSVSDRGEINAKYQSKVDGKSSASPTQAVENNVRDMLGPIGALLIGYQPDFTTLGSVGVLDNSYYTANLQNMVLFNSDWELTQDKSKDGTLDKMLQYKNHADLWYGLFGQAMAKLSKLESKGPFVQGGVREYCDKI